MKDIGGCGAGQSAYCVVSVTRHVAAIPDKGHFAVKGAGIRGPRCLREARLHTSVDRKPLLILVAFVVTSACR